MPVSVTNSIKNPQLHMLLSRSRKRSFREKDIFRGRAPRYLVVGILLVCVSSELLKWASAQSAVNYFGVAYSPYVRKGGSPWDFAPLEDIEQMLRIVSKYHTSVSTYSMGVNAANVHKRWDKTDSNCLVARAAAIINEDANHLVLSISQGIANHDNPILQQKEIDNAFVASKDANRIYPGTVWGLIFTSDNVVDPISGQKVYDMLKENRERAHVQNLKIGTRISNCHEIWRGPNREILIAIAKVSDFIMCNIYPAPNSFDAEDAVKGISRAYYSSRVGLRGHNPSLEVIIGETGWASEGLTQFNPPRLNTVANMRNFWNKMREWALNHQVRVHMFQAFDEPWRTGLDGERHFGWWHRAADNSNYYVEKSTGKIVR